MIVDATGRLFDGLPEDPAEAWAAVEAQGLPLALVDVAQDGLGLSISEAFDLIALCGRRAIALPIVETMIANLLLSRAALPLAEGMASVAIASAEGRAIRVPWGKEAQTIVFCNGRQIVATDRPWIVSEGINLASEPRTTLDWGRLSATPASCDLDPRAVLSAVRAVQISGAIEAMVASSLDYASARQQFGRPLSKFQVIQHQLALLGEEAAAAKVAARLAADGASNGDVGLASVAVGLVRIAEAVGATVNISHQLHGAIGTTEEHPLHRSTLRAMAWREEAGNSRAWAKMLGERALAVQPDAFWEFVTGL
ncbi:acyl-CoA dehydrogenase family protein [Sphingobium ummariense]